MPSPPDDCSPIEAAALSETARELVELAAVCELGPDSPNVSVRQKLDALQVASLASKPIRDRDMAACCVSGLWLIHNFLDESHTISQDIGTPEGSYWHGVMHRREPDFSNAKYWFRQAGEHPIFQALPEEVARVTTESASKDSRIEQLAGTWDAMRFVDLCEEAYRGEQSSELAKACRQIADAEWKLLFQYCLTRAT